MMDNEEFLKLLHRIILEVYIYYLKTHIIEGKLIC